MSEEAPAKKPRKASSEKKARVFTPTPEAKAKATQKRVVALVLWGVAIALELVAIFWLLRPPFDELVANHGFPDWRLWTLVGFFVVIGALSIIGSQLWKKANRLDPASKKDKARFFVQNQLGAIISIIAFLPLIILIFLNKDMDKGQKTTAGIVGIVLAAVSVIVGVDFNPPSVEQYTADQSTVIQLLGSDNVYWVDGGTVYHVCEDVSDIQTGSVIQSGTTAQAIEAGKNRLTLKFASELQNCGLNVPENAEEITSALREIQAGKTDTLLPAPVWADPSDAPIEVADAEPAAA